MPEGESSLQRPGDGSARVARRGGRGAFSYFAAALRERPFGVGVGLVVEYLTFAAAVFLASSLYVTRVPMRWLDRATGLRLRERFVELLARLSPG